MKLRIFHLDGSRSGQTQEVASSQVLIGRDPSCHVVFDALRDDRVSTQHAMLTMRGSDVIVSDLGSRNGTVLNGWTITGPTLLPPDGIVQIGTGGPRIKVEVVPDAPTAIVVKPLGPMPGQASRIASPFMAPPIISRAPTPAPSPTMQNARIEHAALSDAGPRPDNQDFFRAEAPLFVVADGCGGHSGGQIASRLAVEIVGECLGDHDAAAAALAIPGERRPSLREHELAAWFRLANKRVFDKGRVSPALQGMGTTLVACWLVDGALVIANAGDSRLCRLRAGALEQLTTDDTFVQQLLKDGLISKEEADKHPDRNVLVRSIGMKPEVEAVTQTIAPRSGDVYMLASDGVHGFVSEEKLKKILGAKASLDRIARDVIDEAKRGKSNDNATAVLVRIL